MAEITVEKQLELLNEVGEFVKNEINLAATVEDGYYREFTLPIRIAEREYIINLEEYGSTNIRRGLYLEYTSINKSVYLPLPSIPLTDGSKLSPGKNVIEKHDGSITLNPSSLS